MNVNNHNYGVSEDLVLIYDAPDQTTAEIVLATLQSAGIQAFIQNPNRAPASGMLPHLGLASPRGVLVAPADAYAARAVLETREPNEEELAEEAANDPISLEEAEARVK